MMLISYLGKELHETKSNAMPTYHRVARAAQPPSDVDEAASEFAGLPVAGDMSNDRAVIGTNMRTPDHPSGTPTDPASPLPGSLHYQGDTTEDETGSIGDGQPPTKKRPRRTKKVAQKRIRRVTASPSPEAPPDPATAAAAAATTTSNSSYDKKEKIQKMKRTIEMILSSSSSEDDSSDDEQAERKVSATANENVEVNAGATTKMDYSDDENGGSDAKMEMAIADSLRMHQERQGKRSKSSGRGNSTGPGSGGGWLRSFHTSIGGGQGSDSDDDSSTNDDDDDLDDRLAAISRRNWLSSATRDDKLDHMAKISNDADKILQMLLWDVGFDYHIYSHQFEAIRFVAGLESTFPLVRRAGKMPTERGQPDSSDESSSDDEEDESIQDMLRLDSAGGSARSIALRSAPLLPTRGMLLADEMGLVS